MIAIDTGCGCAPQSLTSMIVSGTTVFAPILVGACVGGWPRRVAISVPAAASGSFLFAVIRLAHSGGLALQPPGRFGVGIIWIAVLTAAWLMPPAGIAPVPGAWLNRLFRWFCLRRTYEQVFQPILADMQAEYVDALAKDGWVRAQWIQLLWYVRFWNAVGLFLPSKLLRIVTQWTLR